ncbi:hypothetical protein EPUS_01300 [Endocarpon pusillum Z07020]|uniref:Mid2 domain-containing protein n=1 Tax=Endocarpon pusillum (strain Z07020 / HMAS-L-300199) TaxID=1263415 RepID=U1I1W5_ENDPU|nr:uncharacterized protein EPUS_01300 [Endocarpon pusillum Z07020]ERF75934.1 hypothetical protein EPUS_01300 [Endocarpon pusillum Z07020]
MCMMGTLGGVDRPSTFKALERRKEDPKSAPSATIGKPLPAKTADETEDETPKKSATPTVKPSDSRKTTQEPKKTSAEPETSAPPKTSAATKTTSAATTRKESAKPTSRTPSPTESTKKAASSSESSVFATSMTSPSAFIPASSASSTSLLTSTDVPQPTPILAQQPQAANRVSVGGIVAGVILGAAVLIGMAWIAVAKWRENRRHRAHFGDDEAKHGLSAAGADDHYSSSHDSLLAGGKLVRDSDGLRLQSLSSPRVGAQSFVSSYHSPTSQVPQDVLPTISPIEAKSLPGLPTSEHQFSTALGSHPIIAGMPSPRIGMLPAGQQAGGSAARKPLPQINVSSPVHDQRHPSLSQQSPAVELP